MRGKLDGALCRISGWAERRTSNLGDDIFRIHCIGSFWPLDDTGFLVNDAELTRIEPPFAEAVAEAGESYLELQDVRSMYVQGTVPRGEAVEGISDLDCLAVLERDPTADELSRIEGRALEIGARYPRVSGVALELVNVAELGFFPASL